MLTLKLYKVKTFEARVTYHLWVIAVVRREGNAALSDLPQDTDRRIKANEGHTYTVLRFVIKYVEKI
jgi:hypothetical protein